LLGYKAEHWRSRKNKKDFDMVNRQKRQLRRRSFDFRRKSALQLLSNLVGHDVKKAPVFFRETPWFGVEQADRADREFVHPQRHACIKANASPSQQRVIGETFVAGDIFYNEKLVARNGVRANRERAGA
jgi:hypothetical protein